MLTDIVVLSSGSEDHPGFPPLKANYAATPSWSMIWCGQGIPSKCTANAVALVWVSSLYELRARVDNAAEFQTRSLGPRPQPNLQQRIDRGR